MSVVLAPPEGLSLEFEQVATAFKALSDPTRLKILTYLASDPHGKCCGTEQGICACDLEAVTALSQPTVSHHMKALVATELVKAEKRGKWIYYHVNPKGFAALRDFLSQVEKGRL